MLSEGDKAPSFTLRGTIEGGGAGELEAGALVRLGDLLSEGSGGATRPAFVIVYFYPKDNTPGCTREAQGFSAAMDVLRAAGARVVGVSKDSIKTHCGFRDKYALAFPLLSDPDLAVHRAYGAYGEKTMYGKKVMGTIRSTFLFDADGTVVRVWRNVKVDGHTEQVLEAILGASGAASPAGESQPSPPGKTPRTRAKT